jgi:hypothetical protein
MGLVDSILQGVEGPDADFGGADSPDHLASDLCSFESFLQISSHSAVHWHQYIYIFITFTTWQDCCSLGIASLKGPKPVAWLGILRVNSG